MASVSSAELAVLGVVGTVWELLDDTTDGISDAASITVSLHLGRGMPALAKHSAHTVMYYVVLLSFFTTSILFIVATNIPTWFTDYEVIQDIIYKKYCYVNWTWEFSFSLWDDRLGRCGGAGPVHSVDSNSALLYVGA